MRTRETTMGASGANSTPGFYARLLNATLGTKMKVILGYPGQNDALLAMERGELDGYPSVFYSALIVDAADLAADKKAKAIVQYGPEKLDGARRRAVRAGSRQRATTSCCCRPRSRRWRSAGRC